MFPNIKNRNEKKLKQFKNYYLQIAKNISKYPNQFIIFTPPPLRKEVTNSKWAENARQLADWLKTENKIIKNKNIRVFDFFNLLTDQKGSNKNMLRREYCSIIPIDSHPNIRANKKIGKIFLEYLSKSKF